MLWVLSGLTLKRVSSGGFSSLLSWTSVFPFFSSTLLSFFVICIFLHTVNIVNMTKQIKIKVHELNNYVEKKKAAECFKFDKTVAWCLFRNYRSVRQSLSTTVSELAQQSPTWCNNFRRYLLGFYFQGILGNAENHWWRIMRNTKTYSAKLKQYNSMQE